MKAIVITKYGGPEVLQLQEVEKPTPKPNEVLVKIKSACISTASAMMRTGKPCIAQLFIGIGKPKKPIPGTGFAGVIESIGREVSDFKIGDAVFGETLFGFSTNAEYVCVPADGVILKKPSNISFEEATAVADGALTSINFLTEVEKVKPGQKVLINGASGSLGTAAVQIAKILGAEVTGVCSTKNVELVKSLGVDYVIDYNILDFTLMDKKYDVIYDTVGKSSFKACKAVLTKEGAYISPVLQGPLLLSVIATSIAGSKRAKFSATGSLSNKKLKELLNTLMPHLQSGRLKIIVDKTYTLEQVPDAHRYIDTGRKRGSVVLSIAS